MHIVLLFSYSYAAKLKKKKYIIFVIIIITTTTIQKSYCKKEEKISEIYFVFCSSFFAFCFFSYVCKNFIFYFNFHSG